MLTIIYWGRGELIGEHRQCLKNVTEKMMTNILNKNDFAEGEKNKGNERKCQQNTQKTCPGSVGGVACMHGNYLTIMSCIARVIEHVREHRSSLLKLNGSKQSIKKYSVKTESRRRCMQLCYLLSKYF